MQKIIVLIFASLLITSCSNNKSPDSLEGKMELLSQKKTSLSDLKKEIKALEDEIKTLKPDILRKAQQVAIEKMIPQVFNRFVTFQASVQPDEFVMASSETGGRIVRVYVKEGQNVRKGQLIASIDLESLDKQIQELETSLSLATTVFERQERLWKQEIGSEIQYLEAKTNKERLEKSLSTLRHQLSKKNVYSPISGVVDQEFLKQGEMSSPGMPIVQVLNTRKVKIVADIPESYLGSVTLGEEVDIYFPALGNSLKNKITLLGRTIDPSNRTFKVEIDANNFDQRLKPNLLAEVKVNDLTVQDALLIPIELIQEDVSGNQYVYTATLNDSTQVAQKTFIKTGESYEGKIIVTEGLNQNNLIITEGARNVSNGDSIIIINKYDE